MPRTRLGSSGSTGSRCSSCTTPSVELVCSCRQATARSRRAVSETKCDGLPRVYPYQDSKCRSGGVLENIRVVGRRDSVWSNKVLRGNHRSEGGFAATHGICDVRRHAMDRTALLASSLHGRFVPRCAARRSVAVPRHRRLPARPRGGRHGSSAIPTRASGYGLADRYPQAACCVATEHGGKPPLPRIDHQSATAASISPSRTTRIAPPSARMLPRVRKAAVRPRAQQGRDVRRRLRAS